VSRPFLLRLLETFFRRWFLYLVPLVVFLCLGLVSVASTKDVYVSTGVLYVDDETLLAALTDVRGTSGGQWWKTPAELTSEQMESAFQTEGLVLTMAEAADLRTATDGGTATIDDLRSSLSVAPNGSNLVQVRAARRDPEESSRLANAAITSFIDFVVEANLSESSSAEKFLTELVAGYEDDVTAGREALNTYLRAHPTPDPASRPALEQTEIDRLTSAINTADQRYTDGLGKLEDAQLATAQTEADVSQRVRLVDEPQTPTAPQATVRDKAITMAMFGSLGLLLSAAAVLAGALLDRSIRTAADVTERLHSVALAALPDAPQPSAFHRAPDPIPLPAVSRS
jgi:uncharacterized protein involved in exopolysaccharide biosynthesis